SGVAKVVWALDGSAEKEGTVSQSGEWAVSIPKPKMKAGMLTITAIDTVGNISAPKNIVFLLDEDAPTAKIINFDANSTQTGSITVKGLVEDIGNAGVDSSATAWKIVKRNDPAP
ncbi:Ig-like domain-containing protein, partial [Treponema phagedenis]